VWFGLAFLLTHVFEGGQQMKKLLVALLVLGLAAPAIAAEVGFYGSFRTHLGYYDVSEEYGTTLDTDIPGDPRPNLGVVDGPAMDPTIGSTTTQEGGFDDAGTVLSMSHQSRFGAKAKVSDTLNATFEMGLKETNRAARSDRTNVQTEEIYLRLAFGDWNFGNGSLRVGKDYTPGTFLLYSNMVADIGDGGDAVFLVGGLPYIGRQPQIKLTFGGFQFALIEPNTGTSSTVPAVGTFVDDVDYLLPRMEAAYQFNSPMISLRPVVGYQTYDAVARGADEEEESIDSYLLGLGAQMRLDPIYINATASYMINAGNYGQSNLVLGLAPGFTGNLLNARYVDGSVEDSTLIQGTLVAGAKLGTQLKVEAGVSYNMVEVDTSATATAEQTAMLYYIQMPITLAPGVSVIPELGMLDRGDYESGVDGAEDVDMGEMIYGVASFRIDF
jgi:hypothetical protein